MIATNKNTFKSDVLESNKVILLDVWAPWCAPCRGMEPTIEAISEETKDWADVVKLDASAEMDLAQELGVSGLPTFFVFKSGKVIATGVGATTKANLIAMMQKAR